MKANSWKRTFSAVLAALLCVSAAGCGQNEASSKESIPQSSAAQSESSSSEEKLYYNKTGYPICDETITVTCSGPNGSSYDWNATRFKEEMRDRMGIDIEFTSYSPDDWNTQLSLMISSDTLTDLICHASIDRSQMNLWGADGYFLDISQYLELAPNMNALFEAEPALKATFTSDTGAIYGLNQINRAAFSNMALTFINNRWLKNVGMETPTTTDELYEVLKAFKEQDANGNGDPNDEIPYGAGKGYTSSPERTLLNAFGVYSTNANYCLQVVDGKVSAGNTTENYKAFLKYMHKLYEEGLMDPEAYVQTAEQMLDKGKNDRIGFYGGNEPAFIRGLTQEEDINWDAIMGLTSPMSDTKAVTLTSGISGSVRMAISNTTQYPEALVRLFDYFYTDEGRIETRYGYEGESFQWVEDDVVGGKAPAYIQSEDETGRQFKYILDYAFDVNFVTNKFDTCAGVDYSTLPEEDYVKLVGAYGWVAPIYKAFNADGIVSVSTYPNVSYTQEEATERATLLNDITNTASNAKVSFITGETDIDSGWENYVSELNQMGLERLVEIDQAAYDRFAANMK